MQVALGCRYTDLPTCLPRGTVGRFGIGRLWYLAGLVGPMPWVTWCTMLSCALVACLFISSSPFRPTSPMRDSTALAGNVKTASSVAAACGPLVLVQFAHWCRSTVPPMRLPRGVVGGLGFGLSWRLTGPTGPMPWATRCECTSLGVSLWLAMPTTTSRRASLERTSAASGLCDVITLSGIAVGGPAVLVQLAIRCRFTVPPMCPSRDAVYGIGLGRIWCSAQPTWTTPWVTCYSSLPDCAPSVLAPLLWSTSPSERTISVMKWRMPMTSRVPEWILVSLSRPCRRTTRAMRCTSVAVACRGTDVAWSG